MIRIMMNSKDPLRHINEGQHIMVYVPLSILQKNRQNRKNNIILQRKNQKQRMRYRRRKVF